VASLAAISGGDGQRAQGFLDFQPLLEPTPQTTVALALFTPWNSLILLLEME
jgi:hypothetical protein